MRSEFEFINDMKSRYGLSRVGDDCAVLPKNETSDLLITSDMLVEGIDFRLDWATPEQIGHKALAVSLSDIAAMGGAPTHAMLSLALVENLWKGEFLDRFYSGWHALAREYGVELIGGDVSRCEGPVAVDSTVLGEVAKGGAILRSGASPGEAIFVTGTLGRATGGLRIIEDREAQASQETRSLIEGLLTPMPHVTTSKLLQKGQLATSMIDVSDGLSSDLTHLCDASAVGAVIEAQLLPIEPSLRAFFTADECLDMALNGGEDLNLLFTGNAQKVEAADLANVTRIGNVVPETGIVLVSGSGRRHIAPHGYRHF